MVLCRGLHQKDGSGSSPTLSFDVFVEAKHHLHMRKAPVRDDVPAELLAKWGPVADATVYSLCSCRVAGKHGHTSRIQGWEDWNFHAMFNPHRFLEEVLTRKYFCQGSTLFKLYDGRLWTAV